MSKTDALKHRTAYLSIMSNTTLVLLKLAIGIYVGAVSLISEALHSGVDLIAALIAFWAVRKSVMPPDMQHDYGHGKFENLSAAVEALLIVAAALGILYESVSKFGESAVPEFLEYGIAIMCISIVINLIVSRRLISVAWQTGSQALEADGLHLQSDIWTSVGVLVGLALMKITGIALLDPLIAVFVAGIIFRFVTLFSSLRMQVFPQMRKRASCFSSKACRRSGSVTACGRAARVRIRCSMSTSFLKGRCLWHAFTQSVMRWKRRSAGNSVRLTS